LKETGIYLMHMPLTPIRCLLRARDLYPGKTGIVSGTQSYTYAEFSDHCHRMAAGLLTTGVKKGDRVALLSFNNNVLLESYFGIPLAGGVVMPLNVRLHPSEIVSIAAHAAPKVLLYEQDFSPQAHYLREAGLSACKFVSIDGPPLPGELTLEDLMMTPPLPDPDLLTIDENDIAELFYTSGSTGRPKGVALSHRTLYLHALSLAGSLDHSDRQVVLHTIPLFHANGWGFPQFATMCGMRQVTVCRFEPRSILRLIQSERATIMILVPTMATALIACPDRSSFDVSSLQQILIGGAASSPELIAGLEAAFSGCSVLAGYGLTEASPVIATARPKSTFTFSDDTLRLRYAASAGWPFLGVEARVVDSAMHDVPKDMETMGEIVVRGDNIMDGYYRDPRLTQDAITQGWLHTGDIAVWNEERCLYIVDRKKDIIISGGENIASIEVEHAILAHPAVAECAVVSAPHARWGEVPAAVVVLKEGYAETEENLLTFVASRIAKFKIPQLVRFATSPLPKTGTGKIMKHAIREEFWSGKEKRVQG
jgi:fatty-acyl-CoA synthase